MLCSAVLERVRVRLTIVFNSGVFCELLYNASLAFGVHSKVSRRFPRYLTSVLEDPLGDILLWIAHRCCKRW